MVPHEKFAHIQGGFKPPPWGVKQHYNHRVFFFNARVACKLFVAQCQQMQSPCIFLTRYGTERAIWAPLSKAKGQCSAQLSCLWCLIHPDELQNLNTTKGFFKVKQTHKGETVTILIWKIQIWKIYREVLPYIFGKSKKIIHFTCQYVYMVSDFSINVSLLVSISLWAKLLEY